MGNQITIETTTKKILADLYTPVGIYLRLRDRFRDTILLESADYNRVENSFSFIGINAIAGIEVKNNKQIEFKLPNEEEKVIEIEHYTDVLKQFDLFMNHFRVEPSADKVIGAAQGLFGYTAYDAVQFFDSIRLEERGQAPLMRYRLYQYVIAINHFKNELFICENKIRGVESRADEIETLIKSKDIPQYPFGLQGDVSSNLTDEQYMEMVKKGVDSCQKGDVFQIVLSRRFNQKFTGDEFNVYRALRSVNPSPYLFYFDYGDYRLFGSSPESQLIVDKGVATVHPIAGTFRRTGDDAKDAELAISLQKDKKENAEHVMLVDLARNDLSRVCDSVKVKKYAEIQYFSHVIHMVSEVSGKVKEGKSPIQLLAQTFPAGTLSGAPKYRAMQLIDEFEPTSRGYYGGCIGYIGFNGNVNHAILIRTFLSANQTLIWQAGAGVVVNSRPESELQEVNNKLNALTVALKSAQTSNHEHTHTR